MKFFEMFWNWLTTSAKGGPRKGHPDLYPINVDKLAKELNLIEEAKRLGDAGFPASDAKVPSGPEAAIIQRVEKARQDYVDWAALRLNILSQDLGRRNVAQDVNRVSQADKEFERKASTLLTEQDSLLRGYGDAARKRKEELESFKNKNDINRDAHYPTSSGSYLRYGLLFLLVSIEGILNAGFFAQGMNSGLLGGFSMAAFLAAFNVIAAFLFGKYFIPYVNHFRASWKVLGILTSFFALLFMVGMAFSIAHYRDALSAEVADPAFAALESIRSNPILLHDVFSWALFVISIVFGVASLFDGLYSDDLYPSYGSISRRTQVALDDYEDQLNTLRSELDELKNEELKILDKTVQQSQASVASIDSLISDKMMAGSRLEMALRNADHSLEALLHKFRTENDIHRKGLQRPNYFNKKPDLRPISVPDFNTSADEAYSANQHELVNTLLADVEGVRARIQQAFSLKFDGLKPLHTHFPVKEVK
jgi:hypothetical protein